MASVKPPRRFSCDANGCNRFIHSARLSTRCGAPTASSFERQKYCSFDCSIVANRDLRHGQSLTRINGFLNSVFIAVSALTTPWRLMDEQADAQKLELQIRRYSRNEPPSEYRDSCNKAGNAMLSHNQCTNAILYYAGIVTFLSKALFLPIRLVEVDILGVQEIQQVLLKRHGQDAYPVAPVHSMIKIVLDSNLNTHEYPHLASLLGPEGLFLDPTARQYGRRPDFYHVSTYPATANAHLCEVIGSRYYKHLISIHRFEGDGKPLHHAITNEAIIRTINNAFYRQFQISGGVEMFSDFDDYAHDLATEKLLDKITKDIKGLYQRDGLQTVALDGAGYLAEEAELARSCMGSGHAAITAVLGTISTLPIPDLHGLECF